ncbi:hypothetical protein HGRIS_010153 [Hohenbuehelia grisea]|uniref:Fungal-type protein kinase domain-containing protein n=1 Tax=Hohenbuehelia grisea TaxID=104357 RepID=A0ABR3J3F5_9AGAR
MSASETLATQQVKIATRHPDTPLTKKSNVRWTQTQDLTTAQLRQRGKDKDELKDLLEDELHNSTFDAPWVSEHFCPVLDGQAGKVANALQDEAWDKIDDTFRHRAWPKSMGVRLSADLTCVQFVESLLDAMIGHCALYTEGNYLHRDFSNGNIIYLANSSRSEWKVPKILQGIVQKNTCSAVLIDGDSTKQLGSAASPAGTLPFMSIRLLDFWTTGTAMVHTPLDDLESFIWVLLYDLLGWTPTDKRTPVEVLWWDKINDEDIVNLASHKLAVSTKWSGTQKTKMMLSPALKLFRPLIRSWFRLAAQSANQYLRLKNLDDSDASEAGDAGNVSDAMDALFRKTYQEYLTIGMREAAKLPACSIRSLFA